MDNTENKVIFDHIFPEMVNVTREKDVLKIGDLIIEAEHDQDCCENVYADFTVFDSYDTVLKELGVRRVEIKAVEDMGLVFFFYEHSEYGDPKRIGVLVNCYNSQNGYYSSNLSLVIRSGKKEQKIDVSEVVYDLID